MVDMDQFSRRIIGFAVHAGGLDGPAACRMFNSIIGGSTSPRYLSSDNDPLFLCRQWNAGLRILEVTEVKTVPYVPISYPFVERFIGRVRRGFLDQVTFWSAPSLQRKLLQSDEYDKRDSGRRGLGGSIPGLRPANTDQNIARLNNCRWKSCCDGLYQLPAAACILIRTQQAEGFCGIEL